MEINELTCQNLLDLADVMYPSEETEREAEQADIDRLLA